MHLQSPPPTQLGQLAAQQARFRLSGTGPVSTRTITPVTATASELLRRAPGTADAMRGVLRLVEQAAGGPAESTRVRFEGIAFSTDEHALAANTFQARLDSDSKLANVLARASRRVRSEALEQLAERAVGETDGQLANVVSGWMNLGIGSTRTLLLDALRVPGAPPLSEAEIAETVRTLQHESVHVVDDAPANLPDDAMHGMWEALAEARTMSMPQLAAARRALGFDGRVSDASLAATLMHRPYAAAEQVFANVMRVAGVAGTPLERELLAGSSTKAVDVLAKRLAAASGDTEQGARTAIADAFAGAMAGAR